ncbi:MAG: carbon monoxide dehydrogenase subunit G [Fervidicoccaceae archaeon]
MQIKNTLLINASRAKVAEFFNDPAKVVECVPGIQSYDIKGTNFKAKVKFKVGAISGTFNIEGYIKEQKPQEEYEVFLKGGSIGNSFEAKASVILADQDQGKTKLDYTADAKLGGMLAALGKVVENVAADIVRQLFECAEKRVSA